MADFWQDRKDAIKLAISPLVSDWKRNRVAMHPSGSEQIFVLSQGVPQGSPTAYRVDARYPQIVINYYEIWSDAGLGLFRPRRIYLNLYRKKYPLRRGSGWNPEKPHETDYLGLHCDLDEQESSELNHIKISPHLHIPHPDEYMDNFHIPLSLLSDARTADLAPRLIAQTIALIEFDLLGRMEPELRSKAVWEGSHEFLATAMPDPK